MKICRIIAILLLFTLCTSLISCDQLHFHKHNSSQDNDPHDDPHDNPPALEGEDNEEVTYVYSVVSKMLHLPNCYHVERIKEEYKFTHTGDITPLLQKGYTVCRDCLIPDEEKEEPEEDEELIAKEDATYATNKNSLVVHLLDCYMIESMVEDNLRYTDLSLEGLLELQYRPCGTCMPEEYDEYKNAHPEEFEK